MHYYYAYQLNIHSEILLPVTPSIRAPADVIVRVGSIEKGSDLVPCRGSLFMFEHIGRCLISNGNSIIFEPFKGVSSEMIATNILGGCMSIILRQRGYFTLHASSVSIHNAAIGFLGGSGWGKSTLAAALHTRGHCVLTDDVMALRLEERRCSTPAVIPSFPQCKLTPEAATALGKDPAKLAPLFAHSLKRAYIFKNGFQAESLPLKKLYILAKGDEHSITHMRPKDAFAHLVRHTRAASLIDSQMMKRHFMQCTQLLDQVPCYQFTRKPGLEDLPYLVQLLTTHSSD